MPVRERLPWCPGPISSLGTCRTWDNSAALGSQVGLAVGDDFLQQRRPAGQFSSHCHNTDHPVIPQNLYRMSGGADNTERFEQIGQSWMKHTFGAGRTRRRATLAATPVIALQFHSYVRAAPIPYDRQARTVTYSLHWFARLDESFHRLFPIYCEQSQRPQLMTAHRTGFACNVADLNTTLNQGATYFAEAAIPDAALNTTWCQAHPGQCNMYNNASYRQFLVSGDQRVSTFSPVGSTVRMQPAIMAWDRRNGKPGGA